MKRTLICLSLLIFESSVALAQNEKPKCSDQPAFQLLSFWIGEWDVFSGDQKIGSNKIEWILNECAIVENWRDGRGEEGKSLFYYQPAENRWKQVWVTENPLRPGGVKEKAHIETLENGSVCFQGRMIGSEGAIYLDRTTLVPHENGHVTQIIEISADDGENWQGVFEAVYKRTN